MLKGRIERLRKIVFRDQKRFLLFGLLLLAVLLRLPFLEQPFDNDSASNAYHARLIVRGEPLYGAHHPAHHLPALYYVYALSFWLLGDGVWAIKLVLIPWTMAGLYLLYKLGALIMDWQVGLLAAFFFALLTAHLDLFGSSGQIELFANLPRIGALLLLMYLISEKNRPAWQFVFVGLLSAIAFLFKAIYLSPLALAGFALLVTLWSDKTNAEMWKITLVRGLWVGAGFVLGLLLVVLYFGLLGLLPRLLMVFYLGSTYVQVINSIALVGDQTWLLFFLFPLAGLAINNVALLGFSLAGCLLIMINKTWRKSPALYVVVWYILSFVEAGANRRFFNHYYLLIVPPLSLLSAWFLFKIYRDLKKLLVKKGSRVAALTLFGSLAIILFLSAQQNFNYYYHYLQYKLGQETYQDFLVEGWPEEGSQLVQLQELADYISQHTNPTDYIYYWSFQIQPYYLADRRAPVEAIWPEYVEAYGSYRRIFGANTKYVILDKAINIPTPDWIYEELAKSYRLEKKMGDQEIYRRVE